MNEFTVTTGTIVLPLGLGVYVEWQRVEAKISSQEVGQQLIGDLCWRRWHIFAILFPVLGQQLISQRSAVIPSLLTQSVCHLAVATLLCR